MIHGLPLTVVLACAGVAASAYLGLREVSRPYIRPGGGVTRPYDWKDEDDA